MSLYPPVPKKRRVQRACDSCRHRRKACDGLRMSEKKCTNCIEIGLECTFSGAVAKRSYADVLEVRLEENEQQLYQISPPSTSTSSTPDSNHWSKDSPFLTHPSSTLTTTTAPGPGVELAALTIRSMNTPAPDPHGDDLEYISLKQDMEDLSLQQHDKHFHGKSSGAMLVKSAVLLRMGYEDRDLPWKKRRMHYWTFQPAKEIPPHTGPYTFPPPTLLTALISLYFAHSNLYYPVLHRPTFTRLVDSGLHLRGDKEGRAFAGMLLVVCAIGSRFSDDLGEGEGGLTCGWRWYGQVKEEVPHLFERPSLYNLQYYALAAIFTESSVPAARFTLVGLGLRLATDVGAHRLTNKENDKNEKDKANSELWGRAFWVLVVLDRQISSGLGRACGVGWEDFDLPLPLEVDDEYWETGFTQPPGVPSTIAYFNCFIRLNNILAVGLKGLYALNKTKKLLATRDDNWEEHIVAELDKALSDWVDALPVHLRWDPNKRSDDFYNQSAYLHAVYYWMQMTLHRPLIIRQLDSDRALRSIAISTNAARSCAHICDISRFRKGAGPFPLHIALAFSAGLVLLLNIWSGKRTGLPPEMNTAMAEVRKCMECLRACEERWQSAGLFYDLLDEIAQLDQLPPPPPKAPSSSSPSPASSSSSSGSQHQKRAREEDSLETHQYSDSAPPVPHPPYLGRTPQATTMKAMLPTYPADLRRLPVFNSHSHYPPSPAVSDPPSRSTWYPDQTSTAPLGCPDFTVTMPMPSQSDTAGYEDEAAMPSAFDSPGNGMNSDAMAVWANAPTGFEVDAWGGYFSLISEMSRGLDPELT